MSGSGKFWRPIRPEGSSGPPGPHRGSRERSNLIGTFAYEEEQPVPEGCQLSHRSRTGGRLLLAAPAPARAPFVGLVPRFYDPTSGVVKNRRRRYSQYTQKSLREQVSFVLQERCYFQPPLEKHRLREAQRHSVGDFESRELAKCIRVQSIRCRNATTPWWANAAVTLSRVGSGSALRSRAL